MHGSGGQFGPVHGGGCCALTALGLNVAMTNNKKLSKRKASNIANSFDKVFRMLDACLPRRVPLGYIMPTACFEEDVMRLVTRADWDGLVCAVLLSLVEHIDAIQFATPKDIQDDRIAIPFDSVIANLPYHPYCALWFDHHTSEEVRGAFAEHDFKGEFALAPSTARLIYDHYHAEQHKPFTDLVDATDRIDSAQLNLDDVLTPTGYVLLAYTMDPRTGLNDMDRQAYFLLLQDWLKTKPLAEILTTPEVTLLTERLKAGDHAFRQALLQHSRLEGNVIITDFRHLETPPLGNRFLVYTLFPQANVSVRLSNSPDGQTTTFSVGHNILNRTCRVNIGRMLGEYGGGGHVGVGTAQFASTDADAKLAEIVVRLKA